MPPQLFACAVAGRHIFLDLASDRYFSLPDAEQAAFAALLRKDESCPPSVLAGLKDLGVLTTGGEGKPIALTHHTSPSQSLPETLDLGTRPATWLPDLVEVTALVQAARRCLARKRLPQAFARIAALRASAPQPPDRGLRDRLVSRFLAIRPFVPLPAKCLHDTLALSHFLARRRIVPHIVIGVKRHPFAAHCWLQDGPTVLNDALASARDYQPVLVA